MAKGKWTVGVTAVLSAIVFTLVGAATVIVVGRWDAGPQVAADHGVDSAPVPPWVNPDGTIDLNKVPDRMPVSDSIGDIVGYIEMDKDPNDDPEPGESGFGEWNHGPIAVTNESGDLIVGHMKAKVPGGSGSFTPLETPIPVTEESPAPEPGDPE